MRNRVSGALVAAVFVLVATACGNGNGVDVEDEARDAATTVASQLEGATRLTANLTGAAEAPTAGDPDGTGSATVNLDATEGRICYEVKVQKIDRPVGMHIHEAPAGESGDVVVPLKTPTGSDTTTEGCVDNVDAALMARMAANPDNFYVNVHTDTYPQGAVRGQLSQ